MDEQFTPEYVKFILSNEAKVFQEKKLRDWPGAGSWVWLNGKARLVRGLDKQRARILIGAAWYAIEDIKWLPSLRDLLRIIEGAEWRWKVQRSKRRDLVRYVVSASRGDFADFEFIEEIESDTMLAAAKVAARAVEGTG